MFHVCAMLAETMHRGFRYRLEPTAAQAGKLRAWIGAARFVYNLALEQRRDFWRQYRAKTGRTLNWAAQSLQVTALRAEVDWINDVPRMALEAALRDLDSAYEAFFAGHRRVSLAAVTLALVEATVRAFRSPRIVRVGFPQIALAHGVHRR